MSIRDNQDAVAAFVRENGLSADARARYIDLVSEVGELGKEILKATDYGLLPFEASDAFADEMGDCVFSLLCLCDTAGIDAQAALDAAIAKYKARRACGGRIGSSK